MAFARNHAARRVGFRLQSPSNLRVASTGESTTRRRTRAGSQSTNKFDVSGTLRGRELRGYEKDNHRPEVSYAEPKKRSPYRRGTFLA